MEDKKMCKCTHHKVVPACIVLIGLVVLLGGMDILPADFVGVAWPLLLIVIGVTKMINCKCC